jgi:hypothetical protein
MKFVRITFQKILLSCAIICIGIFCCLLVGNIVVISTYYFHESGHFFFANVLNLVLNFQLPSVHFGTINMSAPFPYPIPGLFELPVPQSTNVTQGIHYPTIGLGGPIFVFVFTSGICLLLYYYISSPFKKEIFCIPIILLVQQVLTNILCGTDNLGNRPGPFESCNEIVGYLQILTPYFVAIVLFVVFFCPMLIDQWEEIQNRES